MRQEQQEILAEAVEVAIRAGANVINIPDTVGYTNPEEYYSLLSTYKNPFLHMKSNFSCHCHDDLEWL